VSRDLKKKRARWRRNNAQARERAQELRQKLIDLLGGRCDRCEGDETTPLTIDHVDGSRRWPIRKLNPVARARRYMREYEAGVKLRVLCLSCNTDDRNIRARNLKEAPF